MSQYHKPKRVKNLYNSVSRKPFKISRSKIDLFLKCPRCFWLDCKLGIGRPPGPPFTLNSAVDTLLKQEFDIHRKSGTRHPLQEKYGIDALPVDHENLAQWRHNFTGVQYLYQPTNFLVTGAIDDLWQNSKGEYIVVDYKATAKSGRITELNEDWHTGYKKQMEVYQWLLRRKNYLVSNTGYFVYCNGKVDREAFDGRLDFDVTLIAHRGDDSWVEKTIFEIYKCLNNEKTPIANSDCDYCSYVEEVKRAT